MNKIRRFMKSKKFVTLVWIIGIFVVWELIAFYIADIKHDRLARMKLPYMHSIIVSVFVNGKLLLSACGTTLSRAVIGFAVGAVIGFLLALLMSLYLTAEKMLYPYLLLSQMIPILGLAPVVISIVHAIKFGSFTIPASDITRIVIASYMTFFPVATNMLSGLKAVGKSEKALMFTYAAHTHVIYHSLMIPFSLPYLFTGLKIAAPLAVTASILVDSLGAAGGIGYNLTYSLYTGNYSLFWASVFCSALIGILSYYLIVVIENVSMPWRRK